MKSMAIFGDILGVFFRFQSLLWVSTVFFGGLKIFYGFVIVFFTALKDLLWIFSFFFIFFEGFLYESNSLSG